MQGKIYSCDLNGRFTIKNINRMILGFGQLDTNLFSIKIVLKNLQQNKFVVEGF